MSRLDRLGLCLVAAVVIGLLAPGPSRADFVNGGFETGDFTGWQTLGSTSVVGTFPGQPPGVVAPPQGSFQALISADGAAAAAADVATFLGTTVGQLQAANVPTSAVPLFAGAAIRQTVSVGAGDQISFAWDFLSNEFANDTVFNDAAFLVLSIAPAGGAPILLANTFTPGSGPVPDGFVFQTGYQTFTSAPFAAAADVTVGLAAFNATDAAFESALLVDSFQVIDNPPPPGEVPEPTSLTLLAIGIAGLICYRWRKARSDT